MSTSAREMAAAPIAIPQAKKFNEPNYGKGACSSDFSLPTLTNTSAAHNTATAYDCVTLEANAPSNGR
jgi:hypothetical protein